MIRGTATEYATALSKLLTDEQMADLLNSLIGCEADEQLTDRDVALLERLFDRLTTIRPGAVEKAWTR